MSWLETADEQTIERVYSFLKRIGRRYWAGRPGDRSFWSGADKADPVAEQAMDWSLERDSFVIPVAAWADVETFVRWLLESRLHLEDLFHAVLAGDAVNGEKFDVDNH